METNMEMIAKASKTVRNKNLLMVAMFVVFTGMFVYDGWWGYPIKNDNFVAEMKKDTTHLTPEDQALLDQWPAADGWGSGWNKAPETMRDEIYKELVKSKNMAPGWKSQTDILVQKAFAGGLLVATAVVIWRFFHSQKRRVKANDVMISPKEGLEIAWDKITKVDNREWKKGYVTLEYKDGAETKEALLDDYIVDDLVPILELLAEKTPGAEVLNPPSAEEAKK